MFEVLILSFIQGITEFIPISSSSHLILLSDYFNFENQSLSIDVSLHIGSFFAIIFYFRKDIVNFYKNKILFLKLFIASIPVMVIGYMLIKFNLIDQLRNIKIIGWTTLLFGILLYWSDKSKKINEIDNNLNFRTAIFIGIFQILSLIPGVSRSGITLTAGRFLEFKREEAAKISFLLSIPTLAAVSFFGINELLISENINFSILNLISIVLSFIFSLITIKYFLKYIRKFSLNLFVIYRIMLGVIILIFSYL
jgi:undecaprenyl-diphosphatase